MEAYEFRNLNEVERQDKPTENTTVMAFEAGQPKQIPASEFGGKGLVVDLRSHTLNTDGKPTVISDISYNPIYEAIMAGQNVVFRIQKEVTEFFVLPVAAGVMPGTGFMAMALIGTDNFLGIIFTNGSYHATEAASE